MQQGVSTQIARFTQRPFRVFKQVGTAHRQGRDTHQAFHPAAGIVATTEANRHIDIVATQDVLAQ